MGKKILILETNAFNGHKRGGSYLQGDYYKKMFRQLGYGVELFIGRKNSSKYRRFYDVIRKIRGADYIVGFGTPLLAFYLQWLSFILNKKGIYCIDSIITSVQIIKDYLKRKVYPWKMIFENFKTILIYAVSDLLYPPAQKLITLASSKYILDKLKDSNINIEERKVLYPRIELGKIARTDEKDKSVVFYGTLFGGRGVIDLLHACNMLWKKKYHFTLIILGWPVIPIAKKILQGEIRSVDKKNIIFKSFVARPQEYVKNATVVVLPFRFPCAFQTPYTLLEPIAMGIPVITTDVGSHNEWVKDGETGLFCEVGDVKDIADKIEKVFTNRKLVKKITEGAYNLMKKRQSGKDPLIQTLSKLDSI